MRYISKATLAKARVAHEAIHDSSRKYVSIDGQKYPIATHTNGCRYVKLEQVSVIEQNKIGKTSYAKRALNGEKLSWVIPTEPGISWQIIEDVA